MDLHPHGCNLPVLDAHTPYSSSKRGFCVRAMDAVNPQSVRSNGRADVRSHGQSVSDPGPCPVRNRAMPASASCPWAVHVRDRGRPCPDTWTGRKMSASRFRIFRVMTRQRLRHFPRESLIACLTPGEASIVTGGTRGRQGESYLDDAQRATQSKGDSRGAEGIPGADARC
jgi:hypothetical protein